MVIGRTGTERCPTAVTSVPVSLGRAPTERRARPATPWSSPGRGRRARRRGTAGRPVNPLVVEVAATDGPARTGRVVTPRGRTGRRPSCRWAPGGRSRPRQRRPRGAGGRGGAGQHVPPDAAARRRRRWPPSGGLHRFTGWTGHTLTDSGGFQVHSLRPKVDDDGVTFASVYDGAPTRLTPETAVEVQGLLGRRHPDGARRVRLAAGHPRGAAGGRRPHGGLGGPGPGPLTTGSRPVPRARRCSASSRAAPTPPCGSRAPRARWRSTSTATASAGCRWGSHAPRCSRRWPPPCPMLPSDRPRYLMGVGDPVGMLESVALGVDQFDCVAPTRAARHGSIWTSTGPAQPAQRRPRPRRRAARRRLPVPDVRPVVAGLPAPPAVGGGADRRGACAASTT